MKTLQVEIKDIDANLYDYLKQNDREGHSFVRGVARFDNRMLEFEFERETGYGDGFGDSASLTWTESDGYPVPDVVTDFVSEIASDLLVEAYNDADSAFGQTIQKNSTRKIAEEYADDDN